MRSVHIKTIGGMVLFLIQYISLIYLIISGSLYPADWYNWIPYFIGWALGIWALISMVLTSTTNIRFAVLFILALNLLLKIRYEERRLRTNFAEYSEYSDLTWRLLPYVY